MIRSGTGQPTTLLDSTVAGQPWLPHLKLGDGVDAVTGQQRKSAVKPFTVVPSASLRPEFTYTLVRSESDAQSLVSASLKASYNLEGVTVSASTSFLEEVAVSELAVTLVAQVSVQESQYAVAPSYELAVTPGKNFRERHGDYFVAGHRAGSSLVVVYQCRFSSVEQRTKFSAALAADVPQVFNAEGSSSFEKVAKETNASISVRIRAQGVNSAIPDSPKSGWTAGSVVTVLLPWFNGAQAREPLESYLQSYRMIDPTLSGEVPVSPDVFAELGFLYNRFWLARANYRTCPDFGRRHVEESYNKLLKNVEAHQASLATKPAKIEELTAETQRVLSSLDEVNNRQAFYTQVVAAAATEPQKGENQDADKGRVRWGYGFQRGDQPGIEVSSISQPVAATARVLNWNDTIVTFRDSSRVIVGWDVVCNWSSTGGDWYKKSDTILGRSSGEVYIKSDFNRGYDWTVTWYTVEAKLYPTGPWKVHATHAADFQSADVVMETESAWTPERMAAAVPDDLEEAPADDGDVQLSAGDAPDRGQVDLGPVTSRVATPTAFPGRTVGKLFYTRAGRDWVASAFVVHRSGIMTAAHCLRRDGQTSTDIVFVPAFQAGDAPFGQWRIDRPAWSTAWITSPGAAWDVGFCTVRTDKEGRGVGDVVGVSVLSYGAVAAAWKNTGYPAEPIPGFPFDGREQWESLGSQIAAPAASTVSKLDELTGGGSGGPWFVEGRSGIVNGLFSTYNVSARRNTSPEFADWVRRFYQHVFG